ncbi:MULTISPECIES: HlyD family secretion protein [Sphingobacterium]|uniref:HlyD family efflux transporter periplasmic adaptor subunit n=1 Tax=Sphingobacterium ginsenosidimutans TaxID=687845 RepID=A0ABP8AFK6_9SPHI|nr:MULTISPECIES: HlyD family efflux transporter periplasmic adaptor subunit [unclassified Sphingobacterium]ULT22393.1 HlyD family secretion protein [Sphingobacterium sp. E70]
MKESSIIESDIHSEDLQDIIAKPPSWLLRRGITFILLTVLLILGMSVFIRYPETVDSKIRFNTTDAPKVLSAKVNGSLVKLLKKDGDWVEAGGPLAYLESTADHDQIVVLLDKLQQIRQQPNATYNLEALIEPKNLNLGELQGAYQNFYLSYLSYVSARDQGIYQKRRSVINQEVTNVNEQYKKNSQSFELQKQQLDLAEKEYEKYKLLAEKKVISPAELQEKEALLLAKRQIIPQMENSLISYEGNILSKNKELAEIENQIGEEQKKFIQALNSFISEAENWKKQYVMTSPVSGKLIYGEFLQINQQVAVGQKLFYINPKSEKYYGEVLLPQTASAKVKKGQKVLIKVNGYPFEEYGYLRGKVEYISDIPIRDSVFFTTVGLDTTGSNPLIQLKPGLFGDGEIITEDKSIFRRIWNNLTKNLRFKN